MKSANRAVNRKKERSGKGGKVEPVRKRLLEIGSQILAEISVKGIPDAMAGEVGDLADHAGDERTRELSLLLTDREKEKLQAVDEALEKLNRGSYGICEECGEPIAPARLEAIPLAKLCLSCQSELEKEGGLQRQEEREFGSFSDLDLAREVWEEEEE
jgi:DnaK suppressor protein